MLAIPLIPEGPWRELSPDMPAPIEVDGTRWPTATHYFLAHRYFFEKEQREAVRSASSPDEARAVARRPSRYEWKGERMGTPADPHMYWKGSRFNVIRRAIHERAVGDSRFVERLLTSSPQPLELDCDEPVLGRPENGWGRLLAECRVRLAQVGVETLRRWLLPPWMKHPEIPQGSIGWRMGYGEAYVYDTLHVWLRGLDEDERRRYESTYGGWPTD